MKYKIGDIITYSYSFETKTYTGTIVNVVDLNSIWYEVELKHKGIRIVHENMIIDNKYIEEDE